MDFLKTFLYVLIAYFAINIVIGYRRVRKQQDEQLTKMMAEKEKYKSISSEMFDEIESSELKMAVVYRIWNKEDEDYENYFDKLTKPEIYVYTLFLVNAAIGKSNSMYGAQSASIENFFNESNKNYIPHLLQAHIEVGCDEKLIEIVEKICDFYEKTIDGIDDFDFIDEDAEFDELEEIPSYSLYTYDYLDNYDLEKMEEKIYTYIKDNKDSFIDQ